MSTDITMEHDHARTTMHPGYHCGTTSDSSTSHTTCHKDMFLNSPSASTSLCSQISDDHVCSYEEYEAGMHQRRSLLMSADELPAFNIQSMSPHSRSLSPIDFNNDHDDDELLTFSMSPCGSSDGPDPTDDTAFSIADDAECMGDDHDGSHVSVDQINALIGTPPPVAGKRLNLETIFEGVFLHTPPRKSRRESLLARQSCKEFVEDQRHHMQPRLDMVDVENVELVEG